MWHRDTLRHRDTPCGAQWPTGGVCSHPRAVCPSVRVLDCWLCVSCRVYALNAFWCKCLIDALTLLQPSPSIPLDPHPFPHTPHTHSPASLTQMCRPLNTPHPRLQATQHTSPNRAGHSTHLTQPCRTLHTPHPPVQDTPHTSPNRFTHPLWCAGQADGGPVHQRGGPNGQHACGYQAMQGAWSAQPAHLCSHPPASATHAHVRAHALCAHTQDVEANIFVQKRAGAHAGTRPPRRHMHVCMHACPPAGDSGCRAQHAGIRMCACMPARRRQRMQRLTHCCRQTLRLW